MAVITNFKDQVTDLAGSIPATITDYGERLFTNGIADVIKRFSIVNPGILPLFSNSNTFVPSVGRELNGFGKILNVTANDGSDDINCFNVPVGYKNKVQKSSDSIFEATLNSPVFYVLNSKIYTAPQYDYAVTITAETIEDSFESGGAIYEAASNSPAVNDVFMVNDTQDFDDGELETAKGSSPAANDYFRITNVIVRPPLIEYLGESSVSEVTLGTVANYETGISAISNYPDEFYYLPVLYTVGSILNLQVSGYDYSALTLTALSLSSVIPTSPTMVAVTAAIATVTAGSLGTAPLYIKPEVTYDTTQFETFLETNEDPELAGLQLGRLQKELGNYQADIQNELNEFNKDSVLYNSTVQETLAELSVNANEALKEGELQATADIQANKELLEKYAVEVQAYQMEVNAEVQEQQANIANIASKAQVAALELSQIREASNSIWRQYEMAFVPYAKEK